VEDVLMRHATVALAAVVGVPDATQGELLAAFVVPKPGATLRPEELAAHCRALASRYIFIYAKFVGPLIDSFIARFGSEIDCYSDGSEANQKQTRHHVSDLLNNT